MERVITEDVWLEELNRLVARNDAGFTTEELADHLGCSHRWAQEKIKKGIKAGLVRYAGKRSVPATSGYMHPVPVYARCETPKSPRNGAPARSGEPSKAGSPPA